MMNPDATGITEQDYKIIRTGIALLFGEDLTHKFTKDDWQRLISLAVEFDFGIGKKPMKLEIKNHSGILFKEWSCCGLIWQLLGSSEGRDDWAPKCPRCGNEGKSYEQSGATETDNEECFAC